MALRKNGSISLSPELHAMVERMLASGRSGSFSEVVRDGLRLLDEWEIGFQTCRDTQDASWQTHSVPDILPPRGTR